ncbi:MAG: hypothetical protein ACXW2Q_06980 [Thermoanaerobaculia bacterium]
MTDLQLDSIRANALKEMDAARRNFRLAFFGASFMEMIFLVAFLMTANFHDRLHLLLLFAVGLVYTPLVLGLFALGAYVDKCTLRVLSRLDDLAAEPRRSE